MTYPIQILVIEGNTAETCALIEVFGGRPYAHAYADVLRRLNPQIECTIVNPCEQGIDCLPRGMSGADFDGVVWTGSSLNAYSHIPAVEVQIELARRLYQSGVPIFGSCWGFQVMTVALGGRVRRNPRGREIGVAREIVMTAEGAEHPMFRGKPQVFDALAAHVDEIETLPEGSLLLAGNEVCAIQAAAWRDGPRSFWGVQYHPEFDLSILANALRRNAADLIEEAFFSTQSELDLYAGLLESIHADPSGSKMKRRLHGIADSAFDASIRHCELNNWLAHEVLPRRMRGPVLAEKTG